MFEPATIGRALLTNRLIRSATFERLCDSEGNPGPGYLDMYADLSRQGLGAVITGFAYVSQDGRAMQPGQAGIDCDARIAPLRRVTQAVHKNGCSIFLQIAHAGRQTIPSVTGGKIYGPSSRKSPYFNHRPHCLDETEIDRIIDCFAAAARRAREAGFDGVQLHAAHGYLIHQFLHPAVNNRSDRYGVDASGMGTAFLDQIIERVRSVCGADFPLLIKISAGDNYHPALGEREFVDLIRFLDSRKLDAIEVSFGTMDHAFNIFRGETIPVRTILNFNPRFATRNVFKQALWRMFLLPLLRTELVPFAPMYNLAFAQLAKRHTAIPIISVGGFRSGSHIRHAIEDHGIDFVSLCRPILCEPDFALRVRQDEQYQSRCSNCNRCAVMCDSGFSTRCYGRRDAVSSPQPGVSL